jgi:hypothetical protein
LKLNHFISEVYGKENIDDVDDLVRDLNFVKYGLVTILLYVKNSEKYNVFLRNVSPTLKLAYPEAPSKIGEFKKDYPRYNHFASEFRKRFELEPQEFDIVITVLHHSETAQLSQIPEVRESSEGPDLEYIPPVLADLPKIARSDPVKLEEKIWILGRMLGYDVEELGHKLSGERRPDAVFISNKDNCAILLDAKVREDAYQLGTDDRIIVDYIRREFNRLEMSRGVKRLQYVIVSSDFRGDPTKGIRDIRKYAPMCQSVSLVTPEVLLRMLETHLKNPYFTTTDMDDILLREGRIEPEHIGPAGE